MIFLWNVRSLLYSIVYSMISQRCDQRWIYPAYLDLSLSQISPQCTFTGLAPLYIRMGVYMYGCMFHTVLS